METPQHDDSRLRLARYLDSSSRNWVDRYMSGCPSRTVLEVLANKWTLLVLGALRHYDRPMRFNELRRVLSGITQKMLTQTLRTLERDGLVVRTVYPTIPPRVEYGITPLGLDAGDLLSMIGVWAQDHLPEIAAARESYDARAAAEPEPVR